MSHPVLGASWEGFVIENILSVLPKSAEVYFYRTSAGAEIDLVVRFSDRNIWAIEIKRGLAPKVSRGFYQAGEDIKAQSKYIVYSGEDGFALKNNIKVISLTKIMKYLQRQTP